ncbi:putative uridine kinase [Lederbergia lenta]|uniref:Putative uridine kinase n=1 Tax=Lederbergia lenta TaxID=1467 RepID=A0A2X4Z3C2_LEDLE|nr:putative uridine kinase [Lederbergia lenta]
MLQPIIIDREGHFQKYDWETDRLSEWQTVPMGGAVIIEGVYSIRNELADLYDFKIWMDCPRETRLLRGLARDGDNSLEIWENNWMVKEDIYVKNHRPNEIADIIIDGTK